MWPAHGVTQVLFYHGARIAPEHTQSLSLELLIHSSCLVPMVDQDGQHLNHTGAKHGRHRAAHRGGDWGTVLTNRYQGMLDDALTCVEIAHQRSCVLFSLRASP